MDELRSRRVAETMREELSELIRYESDDPRLLDVEVSEVVVAADLRHADVLVTLPPENAAGQEALEALHHARNFLRSRLMERMTLFRMPEFRFVAASQGSGRPLRKLLRRARRGRQG